MTAGPCPRGVHIYIGGCTERILFRGKCVACQMVMGMTEKSKAGKREGAAVGGVHVLKGDI